MTDPEKAETVKAGKSKTRKAPAKSRREPEKATAADSNLPQQSEKSVHDQPVASEKAVTDGAKSDTARTRKKTGAVESDQNTGDKSTSKPEMSESKQKVDSAAGGAATSASVASESTVVGQDS